MGAVIVWHIHSRMASLQKPKVDPWELEVFFAAILEQRSECYEVLEVGAPGRAEFCANARRHELPNSPALSS